MLVFLLLLAQTTGLHEGIGGYNPNSRDSQGRTPLHLAASADGPGKLELIRLLVKKGADPNARDSFGASPLDEAVWKGSVERTALLLDSGAKIDARNTRTGATPLNEAAFQGHRDVVELLLARGANPAIKDNLGFSPVENAVRTHHPEVAHSLLAHEKDRDEVNRLLEAAVRLGQSDTVAMLLDAGAAVDTRSASGSTALYDAALKGDGAIVSLLLARGADVNARETASGTTPLYAAASFGREEAVALLVLAGADPNLSGKLGLSPLHAAESNQYRVIAETIRAFGGR